METIREYQRLSEIKPAYHRLHIPYHKPSARRIVFNLKQVELYYSPTDDAYVTEKNSTARGGDDDNTHTIYVVDLNA
jgi:hypothetical protein